MINSYCLQLVLFTFTRKPLCDLIFLSLKALNAKCGKKLLNFHLSLINSDLSYTVNCKAFYFFVKLFFIFYCSLY